MLKKAKKPLIIIGTSAINFSDGKDILKVCAEIAKKYQITNHNFNGLNILQQDISRVGALDIGFYNNFFDLDYKNSLKQHIQNYKPVVFLLGLDEIDLSILQDSFVVYLGHHGDATANIADIILPIPAFPEKTSTFVNMEGRVMQTTKSYNPIGESKEEWKIFRALSDQFENKLNFNNLNELRQEIITKFIFLKEINSLPSVLLSKFGLPVKIKNRELEYNIKNFYMTDSISRSSVTMAKCSKEILDKVA